MLIIWNIFYISLQFLCFSRIGRSTERATRSCSWQMSVPTRASSTRQPSCTRGAAARAWPWRCTRTCACSSTQRWDLAPGLLCTNPDGPLTVSSVWSYKRTVGFQFQFHFLRNLFGGLLAYKGKSVSGLGVTVAFSFRVCCQGRRLCFVGLKYGCGNSGLFSELF